MSKFELKPLPYAHDALEPFIDKATMEFHHDKHHATYVANFNKALEGTDAEGKTIEEIFASVSKYSLGVKNNGGGVWNHEMFWNIMGPNAGGTPSGELAKALNDNFGSFENFQKKFTEAGLGRFGSGWVWLIMNNGKLEIISTANQDNPLMETSEKKGTPLMLLDVWEHAYYLKYQNRRAEYIEKWWNVVNWAEVEKRFLAAK